MKFRFCGDGDCPDWVLAEIISTLSVLDGEAFRRLARMVAEKIVGVDFDELEVKELCKGLTDNGKSAIACLHFLLVNATKFRVSEEVFSEEIQQLGLPKTHSEHICSTLGLFKERIKDKLIQKSMKINELTSVSCTAVDENEAPNCYRLDLNVSQELVNGLPEDTVHSLLIDKNNLKVLLSEMKLAYRIMEKYNAESPDSSSQEFRKEN